MRNLYGTISIKKELKNKCAKEYFNYYKLKNSKYGLEIVKTNDANQEKTEVTNMVDLTDDEEKIDAVLYNLVINEVTTNAEDIVQDLLHIY